MPEFSSIHELFSEKSVKFVKKKKKKGPFSAQNCRGVLPDPDDILPPSVIV